MSDSSTDDEDALPGAVATEATQGGDTGQNDSSSSTAAAPSEDSATSGKQDDNKPKSIADAVRAALDQGKEQSSGSGESEDKTGTSGAAGDAEAKPGEEEELGDLTEEELNSYKGKTQRRFRQLDGKNKVLTAELEQFKPMAELGTTIKGMADKANLTREDVNTGFAIMDMMRNDPIKAYDALTPIYEALCSIVGVRLPADLQEQVTKGEITQDRAQELSRLRAATGLNTNRSKEQDERATKAAETESANKVAAVVADVGKAVTDWETRWQKSDPDYAHKQSRVMDAIDLELLRRRDAGTLPANVKDALAICNAVKTKVEAEFKKILPKKSQTPINHVAGNGAMNGSKPVATSSRDAILQALGH